MAKLNKHAAIIDQLHEIVKKQAEAQSTVVGTPGADTKQKSVDAKTDTINKNEVKPENNKNEFKQEPSKEEAGKVVSSEGVKTSGDLSKLSEEILGLLKKHSEEGQKSVEGTPGADTELASPEKSTETIDKNTVKPEDNKNEFKQEPSKEEAGKVVSSEGAKSAGELPEALKEKIEEKKEEKKEDKKEKHKEEKMASKIAQYNLGASLIVDLLKSNLPVEKSAADKALLKEAGRRDFDIIISQMAERIKSAAPTQSVEPVITEKQAEEAGASYFDELYKTASASVLEEKVAALEEELKSVKESKTAEQKEKDAVLAKEAKEKSDAEFAAKVASIVTAQLESKLKSESVK